MAYEPKEGCGALFINNYQGGNKPDLKGNIFINGEVVKLSAWKKQTKNGDEFISLSVDNFVAEEKKDDNDCPF